MEQTFLLSIKEDGNFELLLERQGKTYSSEGLEVINPTLYTGLVTIKATSNDKHSLLIEVKEGVIPSEFIIENASTGNKIPYSVFQVSFNTKSNNSIDLRKSNKVEEKPINTFSVSTVKIRSLKKR